MTFVLVFIIFVVVLIVDNEFVIVPHRQISFSFWFTKLTLNEERKRTARQQTSDVWSDGMSLCCLSSVSRNPANQMSTGLRGGAENSTVSTVINVKYCYQQLNLTSVRKRRQAYTFSHVTLTTTWPRPRPLLDVAETCNGVFPKVSVALAALIATTHSL